MGICCHSYERKKRLKKPSVITIQESIDIPMTKNEIDELYKYESAICKIKIKNIIGTGFFCEINDDNIPFNKALFTNNHVLNETNIEINNEIEIEYLNKLKHIKITKNRRKFTSKKYDYTCIEILDKDKINKFFKIDKTFFENKNILKNREIFILQFPGGELSHSIGKIIYISNDKIKHNANTLYGSSGSPLITRFNNKLIVGIHFGAENIKKELKNLAIPFDVIIKDIKDKLGIKNKIINNMKNIEYKNIINLIYDKKKEEKEADNLFGKIFVENNRDNIQLIVNDKKFQLIEKYDLKKGINKIQMIILNKLTNLERMFSNCISLINIDELKFLDTKEVNDFSLMFWKCLSLSNIKALEYWDVSNGKKFKYMFAGCSSLSDLKPLENWDVSNGKKFKYMFGGCRLLSDLKPLKKWDVSNGDNFGYMFRECSSLSDLNGLENWDISNGIKFKYMFYECISLSDIKALEYWDVSKGNNFEYMFAGCSLLSDLKPLKNWDVSNGDNFEYMFSGCSSLSNIDCLKNWNVSNGNYFHGIFDDCSLLRDITPLLYWDCIDDF